MLRATKTIVRVGFLLIALAMRRRGSTTTVTPLTHMVSVVEVVEEGEMAISPLGGCRRLRLVLLACKRDESETAMEDYRTQQQL